MNTFLYGPVPTLPNRATPQNASEGEEAPHRFQTPGHAQLGTKENDGPIYTPNGVHALLQRTNAKSTPTVTRVRKAPGTNLCFRACDAVPWKTSAQKAAEEAERVEAMRRRVAEEEEEERKKKKKEEDKKEEEEEEEEVLCTQEEERKSLSSQLLPSFVAASRDAEKENAEGRVNFSDVKKRENDVIVTQRDLTIAQLRIIRRKQKHAFLYHCFLLCDCSRALIRSQEYISLSFFPNE